MMEWLDTKRLSEELGISCRTVEAWRISGDGPPFVRLGRSLVRYRRQHVDEWLAERLCRSTTESGAKE